MSAATQAKVLFERIENYDENRLTAVFLSHSKTTTRTCNVESGMFKEAMESMPHRLVGVYDCNVLEKWIEEDLIATGMKAE